MHIQPCHFRTLAYVELETSSTACWTCTMIQEAVVQRSSGEKVFWGISQNLQENTCARVSFLITLQVWASEVYSEPWHTQNSLFKHFLGYLGIFSHTHRPATREKKGGLPRYFWKSKNVSWIWKKTQISTTELSFPFKI